MKTYILLASLLCIASFAYSQSLSFESYCKSKTYKDSVQMGVMKQNINFGTTYQYHIVQVNRTQSIYKTTYYYPRIEKGLNREVYRTYSIDQNIGNTLGNRDSFNPYDTRDFRSAIINTVLGSIFK